MLAETRPTAVAKLKPLFSQTKMQGISHNLAMLYVSNSCPWLAVPSPETATVRLSVPLYIWAKAMPAPKGTLGKQNHLKLRKTKLTNLKKTYVQLFLYYFLIFFSKLTPTFHRIISIQGPYQFLIMYLGHFMRLYKGNYLWIYCLILSGRTNSKPIIKVV